MVFDPVARLADLAYVFEQTAARAAWEGEILDLEPYVREPSQREIQALPDVATSGSRRSPARPWCTASP
jgi:hypothetical protein